MKKTGKYINTPSQEEAVVGKDDLMSAKHLKQRLNPLDAAMVSDILSEAQEEQKSEVVAKRRGRPKRQKVVPAKKEMPPNPFAFKPKKQSMITQADGTNNQKGQIQLGNSAMQTTG